MYINLDTKNYMLQIYAKHVTKKEKQMTQRTSHLQNLHIFVLMQK